MRGPAGGDLDGAPPGGRAALVLAAGPSSRMGSPKPLLPWADTTLLGYAIRELEVTGASPIVVVLGAEAERVRAALPTMDRVVPVVNPDYATGRSSAIRIGAGALPSGCRAVMVQSVDQPCPAEILESLYRAVEGGGEVALPIFGGRPGHPICFAGRLISELLAVREEDQGLRAVVRRYAATTVAVPVESDVVHLNLNDPARYRAAFAAARWR